MSEVSSEECRVDMVEAVWRNLLINWINKCVLPQSNVSSLNPRILVKIINKYKSYLIHNDLDHAILCTDGLETFLQHKYPALRTWYLQEETKSKKLLMMTSVLLYHCVTTSRGAVDDDICTRMHVAEQQAILKYCEELFRKEVAIYNIESSIREACQVYFQQIETKKPTPHKKTIVKEYYPEVTKNYFRDLVLVQHNQNSKFQAPVTLMPMAVNSESLTSSQISLEEQSDSELSSINNLPLNQPGQNPTKENKVRPYIGFKIELEKRATKERKKGQQSVLVLNYNDSPCASSAPSVLHPPSSRSRSPSPPACSSSLQNEEPHDTIATSDLEPGKKKKLLRRSFSSDTKKIKKQSKLMSDKEKLLQEHENQNKLCDEVEWKRKALIDYVAELQAFTKLEEEVFIRRGTLPKEVTPCERLFLLDLYKNFKTAEKQLDRTTNRVNHAEEEMKRKEMRENGISRFMFSCQKVGSTVRSFGNKIRNITSEWKDDYKIEVVSKKKKWILGSMMAVSILSIIVISIYGLIVYSTQENMQSDPGTVHSVAKHFRRERAQNYPETVNSDDVNETSLNFTQFELWICRGDICEKAKDITRSDDTPGVYPSLSRCIIACSGLQLWPLPTGHSTYSKTIVALSTHKLEYKLQNVPSDALSKQLSEAFKLFISNLGKLEKIQDLSARRKATDMPVRKIIIHVNVNFDDDPRMRVDTDESYTLKLKTLSEEVLIKINAASFCGARHGLETLSQVILTDEYTGYLITDSDIVIKDAPSFRYRGLMLDTGRNFIPLNDIMRTIDAMSSCKLNTFHWRISDVTSFPLDLKSVPNLHQCGAYDRNMVYTDKDVRAVVKHAGYRGVRVLMEVAASGAVGRPWPWNSKVTCSTKLETNTSCNNVPCLRLNVSDDKIFEILQQVYTEILNLTKVDDMFHLSDGLFPLSNCLLLHEDRDGFLEKALNRLELANGGFLPKLPIVWYSAHLRSGREANSWKRRGIQLHDPLEVIGLHPTNKFIHSRSWDLSREFKDRNRKINLGTWQQMFKSRFWQNFKEYTNEGGEALVWTDFVSPGGLDHHIWPRAAAVAERLWSDGKLSGPMSDTVYLRLDLYRWRMLQRGVKVQPIWPAWCSHQPRLCLQILQKKA